jgi:quercetin dioxygenase-like cupin family protein
MNRERHMREPDDLAYDISVCLHLDTICAEPALIWGSTPVGLRPLRRLPSGELRSGVVTLPEGWSSEVAVAPAAHQQFAILSGKVLFGDIALGAGSFTVVPAGAVMPAMTASEETVLILIQDEGQSYGPAEKNDRSSRVRPVILPDVYAVEPFTPVIHGEPLHGFERRVLWIDPDTGADTRLLRIPAGFRGSGANWHPVQEEIFCLEGDIQPDATRPMRAGSYLWNPARSIHGFDEVTKEGCVLLEWHDGPWDLVRA